MKFEFDPKKSEANKAKHGIDFNAAQALWQTPHATTPEFKVELENGSIEERRLTIGKIAGKFWTAVTTLRNEITRIISVRRARSNEEKAYEEAVRKSRQS